MVDQVIKVKARKADPDTSALESENSLVFKLHAKPVSTIQQLPLRLVAQAQLDVDELQDLAARATELVRAAAGFGLKFTVSAELSEDSVPPDSVVAELRRILRQVSPKLMVTRHIAATVFDF